LIAGDDSSRTCFSEDRLFDCPGEAAASVCGVRLTLLFSLLRLLVLSLLRLLLFTLLRLLLLSLPRLLLLMLLRLLLLSLPRLLLLMLLRLLLLSLPRLLLLMLLRLLLLSLPRLLLLTVLRSRLLPLLRSLLLFMVLPSFLASFCALSRGGLTSLFILLADSSLLPITSYEPESRSNFFR